MLSIVNILMLSMYLDLEFLQQPQLTRPLQDYNSCCSMFQPHDSSGDRLTFNNKWYLSTRCIGTVRRSRSLKLLRPSLAFICRSCITQSSINLSVRWQHVMSLSQQQTACNQETCTYSVTEKFIKKNWK